MWARLVSLLFFIGGWTGIIAFVFGLPGHIDDATTWLRWLKVVQELPALLVSIGMVVTGPILWTSGLWCPRVVRYVHERNKSAEVSMSDQPNEDLVRFKDCLSHIKRCRKLIRPYAGGLGLFTISLQVLNADDVFTEIATELEFLAEQTSALGIWSPDIWGEKGDSSLDKVHDRLRAWSSHLARLEAKIHQEDLDGARSLYRVPT